LSNQAALESIRRYRAQGQTDPTTIQITGDDFRMAFQLLSAQKTRQDNK
jgi:transitional endoplasmic reticulum ATPase